MRIKRIVQFFGQACAGRAAVQIRMHNRRPGRIHIENGKTRARHLGQFAPGQGGDQSPDQCGFAAAEFAIQHKHMRRCGICGKGVAQQHTEVRAERQRSRRIRQVKDKLFHAGHLSRDSAGWKEPDPRIVRQNDTMCPQCAASA